VWGVFHATDAKTGWEGRKARVMRIGWGSGGPFMGNGECGRCCDSVDHFIQGCPGGACGGRGHYGGVGGAGGVYLEPGKQGGSNGAEDVKREIKNLLKGGKGLLGKFLK